MKRQGRVPEKAPQQLRVSSQASALADHRGLDVVRGVRREVRQSAVLEIAPEEFHRLEVGRVWRKPDELAAWMSGEPRAHELVLVGTPAIPEQDEWPTDVTGEMAKKPQYLRAANVALRMQSQRQGEAAAPW